MPVRPFIAALFVALAWAPQALALQTTLKANGQTGSITIYPGDHVHYEWTSDPSATAANSTYTIDSPACFQGVGPNPWDASTPNGSVDATADACAAGHTFTITLIVSDDSGATTTATLTEIFPSTAPQTQMGAPPPQQANGTPSSGSMDTPLTALTNQTQQQVTNYSVSLADNSRGQQIVSIEEAKKNAESAADAAGTLAAHYCAAGAVLTAEGQPDGGDKLASCEKYFHAANELDRQAGGPGLKADSKLLDTNESRAIFGRYESRFGVSRDDYLHRLLGAHGNRETLGELTGGVVTSGATEIAGSAPGPAFRTGSEANGLRNRLRKNLAETAREPASDGNAKKPRRERMGHLEPMSPADVFPFPAAPSAKTELTIFDVVSRKYRELTKRQGLDPN